MRIINVVGARPNFMKIAPLMSAYRDHRSIEPLLVHTGQHYDEKMSDLFFRQLNIPAPDIHLEIGSGSHAMQTAAIMQAFEPIVLKYSPDAVLVVGDVNSTIACAMVAAKLQTRLVHVEAGLRSFDRTMPEEINRVLTDAISDLLFCTEKSAEKNLRNEGIAAEKMFLVGNVMIDTLLKNKARADSSMILNHLHLTPKNYAVLTLHRAQNVDNPIVLDRILSALEVIQQDLPVVFPVHPRTRKNMFPATNSTLPTLARRIESMTNLRLIEPTGYLDFIKLICEARVVMTDSGGIQEETTILKVPCLTLRDNTERPVTTEIGSNRVVGTVPAKIVEAYRQVVNGQAPKPQTPPLWDGLAAQRIVKIMLEKL